ncbi:short chain dehydrogenase [Posidoniimonas corsicana]|uniref:Short chain dehydrogenase n=1 Tax=Posidoniimonas corsicana TaxID=1938618 RepID=A0A5C5VDC6_9BACT|nr:hypothetical protein [Posidoniimonas corsicana]TWT36598.1 short chain dehydrogenase [Posidoniimonas corsicana]
MGLLVRDSGNCLQTLSEEDVLACQLSSMLSILDADGLSNQEIEICLLASRVDSATKKPSVETLFHAVLLSLPGIKCIGHARRVAANQFLCSPMAEKAGQIFVGNTALGGPTHLTDKNVSRIANRTDEHYRQRALHL